MLLGLCLGAMCIAWMKHAMTSSWAIAPAPVACMTWLSGRANPSVQVGIVHVQRILYHWRKVIPQQTTKSAQLDQLCWFCDTKWNFNRLHTRPHSCSHWISTASSRQSNKQTLMRAKNCHCDHGTPLPSSHCRLPRKLRLTLTLMVSWNHSSPTWMLRGGKRTKIHQKVVNNDINLNRSIAKAAQNKTPSAGLGRVPKACRHLFFPNPLSILPWANWQTTMLQRQFETLVWKGLGQVLWKKMDANSPWGCRCQSWKMRRGAPPSSWCPEWNRSQVQRRRTRTRSLSTGLLWGHQPQTEAILYRAVDCGNLDETFKITW